MKLATWNVNSVRARLPRILDWVRGNEPDLLCLQETKVVDEDFPVSPFEELGYTVAVRGQKAYNGVALAARGPLAEVTRGLPGGEDDPQARAIAATFRGLRVLNLYVPNGESVESEKYQYKMVWLDRLKDHLARSHSPADPLLLCGDLNIAPEDRDVYDPERWRGRVMFSDPEKAQFRELLAWGLRDGLRLLNPEAGIYTWWDYRTRAFASNRGLRIDHVLVTDPVAEKLREVRVDRDERGGEKPSDHAPVVALLDWDPKER